METEFIPPNTRPAWQKPVVIVVFIIMAGIVFTGIFMVVMTYLNRYRTLPATLTPQSTSTSSASIVTGPTITSYPHKEVEIIPTATPTVPPKTLADGPQAINVLVIRFLPRDSANPDMIDAQETGLSNSIQRQDELISQSIPKTVEVLNDGTRFRGYKNPSSEKYLEYKVALDVTYYEKIPRSKNRILWNPGQVYHPDYTAILEREKICELVNTKRVSQVWMFGYHHGDIEPVETNMSMGTVSKAHWNFPTYGDVSNSELINDLPQCERTYVLLNYAYGNADQVNNNTENHAHHIEEMFKFANTDKKLWDSFIQAGKEGAVNHCGNVHIPPNGTKDYDWNNERTVKSDCEDWRPEGGGVVLDVNCHTWMGVSCLADGGVSYKRWWMQNIPGYKNNLIYQGGRVRNVYEFVADFDEAISQGKTLYIK